MKDYGKPEMATIIFAKKKNPKNDSSIDLDVIYLSAKQTKSGQAKKSARGMPWH